MITLAVLTGIAPQAWADLGARGVATAFELIDEKNGRRPKSEESAEFESPTEATGKPVQYSG